MHCEGYRKVISFRITLKDMHRLWHEGIPDLRIRPLKHVEGKFLAKKDAKASCRARGIITELEKYLDSSYWSKNQTARDRLFNEAFRKFVQFLEPNIHTKRSVDEVYTDLQSISYCSLYENYLLPAKKHHALLD